ncbi:MAG: hypothetical protein IKC69_01605, partial [Clostridia bacterium]|nr:hypothetical protein [Clostridia bacterium]
ALDEMTSAPLTKKEDTTLDGVECISYSYLSEGTRGFVWRKKTDGALMKIILIGDTCEAEINFFKDNE